MLTSHRKKLPYYETLTMSWARNDPLVRRKQRKRDMIFGTWNVRSLYRAGSLTRMARDLERNKLDLTYVQEVAWDKKNTVRGGNFYFFLWKGSENHELGTGLVHHRTV